MKTMHASSPKEPLMMKNGNLHGLQAEQVAYRLSQSSVSYSISTLINVFIIFIVLIQD
jgi:hypothetical protein